MPTLPALLSTQVRWFNYGVGEGAGGRLENHPDEVWYRLSLDPAEAWKKIPLKRRVSSVGLISDQAYDLYDAALPMTPEKIKDLSKFRKWLPMEFHSLYPDYDARAAEDTASDENTDGDRNMESHAERGLEVEDEDEDEDRNEDLDEDKYEMERDDDDVYESEPNDDDGDEPVFSGGSGKDEKEEGLGGTTQDDEEEEDDEY
jgi:hypothetical protein